MKILVVTQYFWPENFRINDLVLELKNRGHDITVLTGLPNYPDGHIFNDYKANPAEFMKYHSIPIIRVPIIPRGTSNIKLLLNYVSFVLSASIYGLFKLKNKSFDRVFVLQASPITSVLPAILISKVKKAPIFMWIIDLWPETLVSLGMATNKVQLFLVEKLVRFIYQYCEMILIQSKAFHSSVVKYARKGVKIRYFPSWSEPMFNSKFTNTCPEMLPFKDKFKIVFAGNIGVAQDFPAILDAAELLKNYKKIAWIIIGSGRMKDYVENEIHIRGLEENVYLIGRYPLEMMPVFFAEADALLVTLKESPIGDLTIPGKLQAYLASGVPILGMMNGEGAKVIKESGAGLVASAGNGIELANKVKCLEMLDEVALKQLGENGKMYCHENFNRDSLISNLEHWLENV